MGLMGQHKFAFATRHTHTCKGEKANNSGNYIRGGYEIDSKCKHAVSEDI